MKRKNVKLKSRRSFVKSGLALSAITILPRHVLGGKGFTAPSDQLNIAAIGSGGKGASDISNASRNGNARVGALCDVDFSGSAAATAKKFPKAKRYADFREMLDKEKDLDAVTISTPDHVHGVAAIYAMERGKHVYVQKPITHNIREARILTEMARKQKVVTQMGNQGGSNPIVADRSGLGGFGRHRQDFKGPNLDQSSGMASRDKNACGRSFSQACRFELGFMARSCTG